MLKAGGYLIEEMRDGRKVEHDTITCAHGNEIVVVSAGHGILKHAETNKERGEDEEVEYCPLCKKPLCRMCGIVFTKTGKCRPFEKWLDQKESAAMRRKALPGG